MHNNKNAYLTVKGWQGSNWGQMIKVYLVGSQHMWQLVLILVIISTRSKIIPNILIGSDAGTIVCQLKKGSKSYHVLYFQMSWVSAPGVLDQCHFLIFLLIATLDTRRHWHINVKQKKCDIIFVCGVCVCFKYPFLNVAYSVLHFLSNCTFSRLRLLSERQGLYQ